MPVTTTSGWQAAATKAIADDAQRDLDLALPALESAVACLNSLKKSDIDEVRLLLRPDERGREHRVPYVEVYVKYVRATTTNTYETKTRANT